MAALDRIDILCVVNDRGPLEVIGPIARLAHDAGLRVSIVAPVSAHVEIMSRYNLVPVSYDAAFGSVPKYVRSINPRVMITGWSSDAFERPFIAAANQLGIPVIFVSDIRGAWKRTGSITCCLVLTADDPDAAAARAVGFGATVVGYREAVLPEPSMETRAAVQKLRENRGPVILFSASGQPARFDQELQCVLSSYWATRRRYVLVFQANTKIFPLPHPEGGTWAEWIGRSLPAEFVRLDGPVVLYADVTISPSSSALRAVAAGKIGVGLRVRSVENVLAKEAGVLDQLTMYETELGMPILRDVQSLSPFFATRSPKIAVRPFDPILALREIRAFAQI